MNIKSSRFQDNTEIFKKCLWVSRQRPISSTTTLAAALSDSFSILNQLCSLMATDQLGSGKLSITKRSRGEKVETGAVRYQDKTTVNWRKREHQMSIVNHPSVFRDQLLASTPQSSQKHTRLEYTTSNQWVFSYCMFRTLFPFETPLKMLDIQFWIFFRHLCAQEAFPKQMLSDEWTVFVEYWQVFKLACIHLYNCCFAQTGCEHHKLFINPCTHCVFYLWSDY